MTRSKAAFLGSALLASLSMPALAQQTVTAVAQTPPADTATPQGGLEDIVVTARKRIESAQNVPVAVTAFTASQLKNSDLSSLEKVSAVTPSFTIARASNGSGAQISLRGIGSDARSVGLEQSVAVIVDGVYYGQGRVINEAFLDLSGLEILKGPQALFFGKNATAGVVSINTAGPTDKREFQARVGYEFNAQRPYTELIASGPLTENFGARAVFSYSKMFQGYATNAAQTINYTTRDVATGVVSPHVAPATTRDDLPGETELFGRITLRWQPTDRLTLTLKGSVDRDRTKGPNWNNLIFFCARGVSSLNASAQCGRHFVMYENDLPNEVAATLPWTRDGGKMFSDYRSNSVTGTIAYNLDKIAITSVSNYYSTSNKLLLDADFQSGPTQTAINELTTFRQVSNETRATTSFDGPINLLIGGYFQDTHRGLQQIVLTGNVENSAAPARDRYVAYDKTSYTDGRTYSAYGQVIWKVVPNVELTGGVRYVHETKDSLFVQTYVNPTLLASYAANRPVTADQVFNNWSPEATITYHPARDLTLYAAYKTAYKSGGFSNSTTQTVNSTAAQVVFQPEKAHGFEGGIKGTVWDHQLRFDLTAYDYRFSNLQIEFFNSATFAQISTNAGTARTTGVELQAELAPRALPGMTLRGSINYNHARYVEFIAPCYAGETLAQGCNTVFLGGLGQNLAGAPTSVAPRWTGSIGVNYLTADHGGPRFGFSIDSRYSDHYLASPIGNPATYQPAYATLDASARVLLMDSKLELAVIGKNLTNQFIVTGAVDAPSTGSGTGTAAGVAADQRGYVLQPRTVQIQATMHF